jgi:drug/metabolite transporter (DMT)-like permease
MGEAPGRRILGAILAGVAGMALAVGFGSAGGGGHAALPGVASYLGVPFGAALGLAVAVAALWHRDPATLGWAVAVGLLAGMGVAVGAPFRHGHIALDGWDRVVTGGACAAALVAGVRWWRRP